MLLEGMINSVRSFHFPEIYIHRSKDKQANIETPNSQIEENPQKGRQSAEEIGSEITGIRRSVGVATKDPNYEAID